MQTVFMLCAVIGGTILLVQFALTLLGFMDVNLEIADDVDFDGVSEGADALTDSVHDAGGIAHGSHVADWFWNFVSFRTVTAGLAFFGTVGLAMRSSGASPSLQLSSAMIAGLGSMYVVNVLMRGVQKLAQDNTMQIQRAIGKVGTVYLTIPAEHGGTGKVHLTLQGRLEEFEATTPSRDKLPVGAKVVVIGIVGTETLAVELADVPAAKPANSLAETA